MKELILNEKELVSRCNREDRHAQQFLFDQFYSELYLIAMRYLSDHHDAEDAVSLSFIKVFRSLHKFRYQGAGSLGKWVRTILINESIRILKKKKLMDFTDDVRQLDMAHEDGSGLQQMQVEDIVRMIEKLPTGYRTVFNLFVIEGFSHKEIATMLAISENTSKTQLKKARNQLMNNINQERNYGTI